MKHSDKLRLCLVAVKRFPENTYFPEMLISGKGKCFHVFGCISKNFPENIFWCLEKKKENTNQKTQATIQKKKSSIPEMQPITAQSRSAIAIRDRDHGATARSRSETAITERSRSIARSRLRRIAIDGAIAIAISPSIAPLDWSWSSRSRTGSSPLSRARALSLSLIFRKYFEGKIEV